MKKNKGRKIYKTKEKNYYGKSPAGKAFSAGLSVLLIGGIGFIGYSIAEPIVNYSKKKGDNTSTTSISEQLEQGSELSTDIIGETIPPAENIGVEDFRAAAVTTLDLTSIDSLNAALSRIPQNLNIEYVEVPLKVSGGEVYYLSSAFYATQSGAIQSSLTLSEIVKAVKDAGYKPAAIISTFKDHILPRTDRAGGYITEATDEQWIDNNADSGGKPWASPYSDIALKYISELVTEAADAGFEKIICSDMVYPDFRSYDLEILGSKVSSSNRYMALTSAANLFYDTAVSKGASMQIEVSAEDLLKGKNDVISQPMMLNVSSIVLNINIDSISYGVYTNETVYEFSGTASDKVKKMLQLVSDYLRGFRNIAVRISGSSVGTDELIKAKEVIGEFGYRSFVIG